MRQLEIRIMGQTKQPESAPDALIRQCTSARQALALCISLSGLTDELVAERVGISKGHMSKIRNGRAALSPDMRLRLMFVCGNTAPLQYDAMVMGVALASSTADRQAQYTAGLPSDRWAA